MCVRVRAPCVGEVKHEVHKRVAELIAWSMKAATCGTWPMAGLDGEKFDPKSVRGQLCGQPLANGWRLAELK